MTLPHFLQAISQWEGTFIDPVLRYIGIRDSNGLRVIKGNLDLGPITRPELLEPIHVGGYEVGHLRFPEYSGRALELVSGLASGAVVGSSQGAIRIGANQGIETNVISKRFFEHEFSPNSKCLSLWIALQQVQSFPDTLPIDSILRSGSRPYENLKELLAEYGVWTPLDSQTVIEIDVHRPLELMNDSKIESGVANIQVVVHHALPVDKVRLGFKIYEKGGIRRESLDGSLLEWQRERLPSGAEVNRGTANISVESGSHLHCFGSYESVCLHQVLLGDPSTFPNWRRAVYEGVDPSANLLDAVINSPYAPGAQSRELETAVSALLWLLGFSCLNLAGQKFSDGPDVLALTPQGRLLVVECTTGLPDEKDKLAKLTRRSQLIRDSIVRSGFQPPEVLPVVVSGLPVSEVRGHLQKARHLGVAVLSKESILDAKERVFIARDPDEIFREIEATLRVRDDT